MMMTGFGDSVGESGSDRVTALRSGAGHVLILGNLTCKGKVEELSAPATATATATVSASRVFESVTLF
jgi:hypothetical protein